MFPYRITSAGAPPSSPAGASAAGNVSSCLGLLREDLSLEELRHLQQLNMVARQALLSELDDLDVADMIASGGGSQEIGSVEASSHMSNNMSVGSGASLGKAFAAAQVASSANAIEQSVVLRAAAERVPTRTRGPQPPSSRL